MLFGGNFLDHFHVGIEIGVNLAVVTPLAAAEGRDQHGLDAGCAGFVDIFIHVLAVGGFGIGFAIGALAALIVVAELNEHVVGLFVENFFQSPSAM